MKKEEREEEKLAHIGQHASAHGQESLDGNGNTTAQYPAFAEPPPPATSFHKEGDAKVVIGTGVPTSEVDAVLSKVKALLRKRHARFNGSNGGFSKSEATLVGYRRYRERRYHEARVCLAVYSLTGLATMGHFIYGNPHIPAFFYATLFTDMLTALAVLAFVLWSASVAEPRAKSAGA